MLASQPIDDATAEALLAGRLDGDPLAAAIHAYREAARRPLPAPSAELTALMVTGGPATLGLPGRAANRTRPRRAPATARRTWSRIRTAVVAGLAVVAAKLASLSLPAKAAGGLALALASLTTAGVTGVLPDPAQERFDTVVESVTGDEDPPPAEQNPQFGERVSEDARDGGVDGEETSEDARRQGEETSEDARRQGEQRPPDLPAPVPDLPAPVPDLPAPVPDLPAPGPPSAPGSGPADLGEFKPEMPDSGMDYS